MDREITYTLVVIEKFILDLLKGLCYEMDICLWTMNLPPPVLFVCALLVFKFWISLLLQYLIIKVNFLLAPKKIRIQSFQ